MTTNYTPASLVTLEKENIHFNTLMSQAHDLIEALSGAVWTDTAIHDPGITLLESLAWNLSDLSYRCLLPLQDLLTSADAQPGDTLFPADFMPEQMLTTSPITLDDYRRGILDLFYSGEDKAGYYFSDARVTKQQSTERFKYSYDEEKRQFVFEKESNKSSEGYTDFYLNGSYEVKARRAFLPVVISDPPVGQVLENYLEGNRNLCELFRKVEVIDTRAALQLTINIEVSETMTNVNDLYAELYIALHHSLALPVVRHASLDLANGDYSGPRAHYGWITELPSSDFGTGNQKISVGQFLLLIDALNGVNAVRYISLSDKSLILVMQEQAVWQYILWTANGDLPVRIEAMLKHVHLYRKEIRLEGDVPAILTRLQARLKATKSEPVAAMPVGRYRHPGRYYPASSLVPSLYNLQSWSPDSATRQLHRFMLGFEQTLASKVDGLERLCRLLNFKPDEHIERPVYGSQWPFAENTPYDSVHHAVKDRLITQDQSNQHSRSAELALFRFLLEYFGIERLDEVAETDPRADSYLQISRVLLQHMPQVGYARTAIHINQVSSLQRRLAGQLGYGLSLFDAQPDMAKLPFYLVEHPLLLPDNPTGILPEQGEVKSARMVTVGDRELLLIEACGALKDILTARHMINLRLPMPAASQKGSKKAASGPDIEIANLLVIALGHDMADALPPENDQPAKEDKDNCFFLYPAQFRPLRLQLELVLEAATAGKLSFAFSNVWLNEMSYMLEEQLAEPVEDKKNTWKIYTASDQPWPAVLRKGDTLTLEPVYSSATENKLEAPVGSLTATVSCVNGFAGYAIITVDGDLDFSTHRYSWYISSVNKLLLRDRFSFTLSLVFRRSLISGTDEVNQANSDEYERELQRIRRIVQAEMPAHIQTRLLWLSDEQFNTFASTYDSWQQNRTAIGESTLKLLRMLSVGMLQELVEGIGEMIIPAESVEEQLQELIDRFNGGNEGGFDRYEDWTEVQKEEWQQLINSAGLLFVAPDGPPKE